MDSRYTVFVDYLPYFVDHRWLRKVFNWYGRVITSFVSRKKREGKSYNFGFISFGSSYEALAAIRSVNRTFVGSHRLLVKMALYRRPEFVDDVSGNVKEAGCIEKKKIFENPSMEKSYAAALRGGKRSAETLKSDELEGRLSKSNGLDYHRELFKAEDVNDNWLENCLVGFVRKIELLNGLQNAFVQEGVLDIKVAAMGGRSVLLQFESVEDKLRYAEGNAPWLSQWFEKLVEWSPLMECNERLVWLRIKGVPLNAWEVQNFRMIGERFGDVIAIDEHTSNKKILDYGRVLISTKLIDQIDKEIILDVKSSKFLIYIKEDVGVRFLVQSNRSGVNANYLSPTKSDNVLEDQEPEFIGENVSIEKEFFRDCEVNADEENANGEEQNLRGNSDAVEHGKMYSVEVETEINEDSEALEVRSLADCQVGCFEGLPIISEDAGKHQLVKGYDESSEEILIKDLVKRKFIKNRIWKGRYNRLSDVLAGYKRGKHEKKRKNKVYGLKKKKKVDYYEESSQSKLSTSIDQDPNDGMECCNDQDQLEDFRDDTRLEAPSDPLTKRCRILERDTEGILNTCEILGIECVDNRENIRKFAAHVHARERPFCCC